MFKLLWSRAIMALVLAQGFCPLKIEITQFPDGFCLNILDDMSFLFGFCQCLPRLLTVPYFSVRSCRSIKNTLCFTDCHLG